MSNKQLTPEKLGCGLMLLGILIVFGVPLLIGVLLIFSYLVSK